MGKKSNKDGFEQKAADLWIGSMWSFPRNRQDSWLALDNKVVSSILASLWRGYVNLEGGVVKGSDWQMDVLSVK